MTATPSPPATPASSTNTAIAIESISAESPTLAAAWNIPVCFVRTALQCAGVIVHFVEHHRLRAKYSRPSVAGESTFVVFGKTELPCAGDGTTTEYRHRRKIDLCPSVPEIRTFAVFGKMELLCAGAILTLAV